MRLMRICLVSVLLLSAALANAQGIGGQDLAPRQTTPEPDEILLKDGTLLRGQLLEERDDLVVFQSNSLGRLEIPRADIRRMAVDGDPAGVYLDPDQNTTMFCPTPATMEKGDVYFRDYELFFLNFGLGLTDAVDLSLGTLFPLSTNTLMISVGGKVRLVNRDEYPLGLALVGSYTRLEDVRFGAIGGVVGAGNARRSLNLSVQLAYDDDGDTETVFILGGDIQLGRRSKLIGEFFSSSSLLLKETDDLEGFVNFGIKLFGDRHSFSLTGFRPLTTDTDSFIAFPMIMYSSHF